MGESSLVPGLSVPLARLDQPVAKDLRNYLRKIVQVGTDKVVSSDSERKLLARSHSNCPFAGLGWIRSLARPDH